MDITKLLKRFPKGFTVSPTGKIYEILDTFTSPEDVLTLEMKQGTGLILAGPPIYQQGDDEYLPKKLSEDEIRQTLKRGRPF